MQESSNKSGQNTEKLIQGEPFVPYHKVTYTEQEAKERAEAFYSWSNERRTVRDFSDTPIPKSTIASIIKAASTAPSGANRQPWTFVAVSSPEMKRKIREAAEKEEQENYGTRMSESWKEHLKPFGTNAEKPFLEIAPWLIIVFKRNFELNEAGEKEKNYYVQESVGLAAGMLLTAIHNAGYASLTHTPSPMNFLEKILDRPSNEKAFLLVPVGLPADDVHVPKISRKEIDEIAVFIE